jgi:Zn-dependent protease
LLPNTLVCRHCHTLVHAPELTQLTESAKALEEARDFTRAKEEWLRALPLLPVNSRQASWIEEHARRLPETVAPSAPPRARSKWLGPFAAAGSLLLALSKGKALLAIFNAKFLLSFGAFFGVYWSLFGFVFGLGFVCHILIHEMGHYIDVRRRGLPADVPMFLPGLGAYVRWNALGISLETRAAVSLAGPLAGAIAAAFCAAVWWMTGDGIWGALARSGAWLNLLNLIPVFGLDGGHAFLALARGQRLLLMASSLVLFLVVKDAVLFLIALGAAWRLFTKDFPEQPSTFSTAYFAAVLCALAALVWVLPGQGFGTP